MSELTSTLLTDLTLVVLLGLAIFPLGNYMARVFQSDKVGRVENSFYKTIGIDSRSSQSWKSYAASPH